MMLRTTEIALRTAVTLWAGCVLSGCGDPPDSPETEIRAWVAEGQRLAEQKQRNALVNMISPAYQDSRGNTRDDIENMFRIYFLRQNAIELLTSIDDIRIFGDTAAELDLTVGMAGTNDGALGFSADAYRFELELVREDDEWLLLAARWGGIGDEVH